VAQKTMALFKKGIPAFNMMIDPNRQQIIVMLCRGNQMTVNEITDQLELSRPAVSHHLKLLLDAGLVVVTKRGTERYYTAHMDDALVLMKELTASLENDVNFGKKKA
jgi:DNA-binding transcriptional ArsR family regulator